MKSTAATTRGAEAGDAVTLSSRVRQLARNHRPVAAFSDRPVAAEAIECLLDAARHAHSANEAQPWRFVVVQKALTRHRLASAAFKHPHVRSAPVVVACCARVHSHVSGTGRRSHPVDLAAAAQSMLLAAEDLGLGATWVTGFREASVREALEIPDDVPVVALLAVGHAEERTSRAPRDPVEDVVAWERWEETAR